MLVNESSSAGKEVYEKNLRNR